MSVLAEELKADGLTIVNLSDSNPTRHGLSPDAVIEALSDRSSLMYSPDPKGLVSARLALARRFGGYAESYFLSASTSEAYSWLFKLLCNPGDSVLVPKPGYPLFDSLAGLECIQAVPYRLAYTHPRGWSIDIDDMIRAARTSKAKAIVVINPNNPTGSYVSASEKAAIVKACSELDLALIADEVFLPYTIEAEPAVQSFRGSQEALTFTLDGLSKLLCLPQLKLGWMRVSGPAALVSEASIRLEIIADTYLSAGAPVMHALPALLLKANPFVHSVRCRLIENLATARHIFGGDESPYRVLRCDGGWSALLEYPRVLKEEALALSLLEKEHIAVQPGYFFDMERDGYLSISLILQQDIFAETVSRVRRHIDSLLS
ncbi:MAG: pyridoxal phosphate-dependent aminotransferase [Spirochaetia bacterium]|jgi:aspartate/methionine/tyrosine aminotransferase|nr:pyridoxal phosphate-dependent aminotransferase [Spirochaetia bacterium]